MPMDENIKNFWDQRFASDIYAYGNHPSDVLKTTLPNLPIGQILFPAEGEGRNALYAAQLGWKVDAFDISTTAKIKAERLFTQHNVSVNYYISAYNTLILSKNNYDAVVSIYAHTEPATRIENHSKYETSLKSGGLIILEGFSKKQINFNSGGPKLPDWLYDENIVDDFPNCEILLCEEKEIILDEGPFHQGAASVIRLIAKKIK